MRLRPTARESSSSRARGPGSRTARLALLVVALGAVLAAPQAGAGLARPGSTPNGGTYGQIPSWLPKAKVPVGRVVVASAAHPRLAIQGDTVAAESAARAGPDHRSRALGAGGGPVPGPGDEPVHLPRHIQRALGCPSAEPVGIHDPRRVRPPASSEGYEPIWNRSDDPGAPWSDGDLAGVRCAPNRERPASLEP